MRSAFWRSVSCAFFRSRIFWLSTRISCVNIAYVLLVVDGCLQPQDLALLVAHLALVFARLALRRVLALQRVAPHLQQLLRVGLRRRQRRDLLLLVGDGLLLLRHLLLLQLLVLLDAAPDRVQQPLVLRLVRRRLGSRRVEVAELVVAVARLVHHQHVVDLVLAAHLAVLLLQQQAGRVHALAHLGALLRLALQRLQLVARLVQLGRQPLVLVTLAYLFAVLLLDVQVPRLALLVVRLEPLNLGAQLGDALRAHALRVLQLLQLVEAAAARELLLQLLRLPLQPPDLLELLVHLRLALLLFGRRLLLGLLLLAHLRKRLVHLVLQRLQVVAQVLLMRAQLRQRRHLHRQVRLLLEVVHRGQRDLALVLRLELLVDPLAHALLRERGARRPRLSRRHRPLAAVSGLQAGQLRVQRRPVVVVQQHPDRAAPLALLLFLVARLLVLLLLLLVVFLLGQRLEQPQLLDDARLHLQQLAHAEHGRGAARLLALSQQLHAQLVLRGHDPLQRLLPHELAALGRRHRLRLLDAEAARPHGVVSQLRPQPAVAQLFAPDGLGRVHD